MDIDSDLDLNLLQQFSCLGTTDRDVLICQLQKVLGYQLNPAGCAFFLDMNNWNLQAAVCSYFDFEVPAENGPCMTLVKDVTIGEGEAVPPNTRFIKTWRIQNTGEADWPPACTLKFVGGDHLGHMDSVSVDSLRPGETTDVSIEMASPGKPGIYQGQWRMAALGGRVFGEVIWVILTVAEGGLLAVTQQMEAFHQLGSPPRGPQLCLSANPFATGVPGPGGEPLMMCDRPSSPFSGFPATPPHQNHTASIHQQQHNGEPLSPMRAGIHETVLAEDAIIRCPSALEHSPDDMMS